MSNYKSWLSNLASNENAAALSGFIKQAVSQVESGIDRVLDIQPAGATSPKQQSSSAELPDDHTQEPHGSPAPTVSSTLRSLQSTFSAFTAPAAPAAQQESSTSHSQPPLQPSFIPVTDDFFTSLLGDVLPASSPKNAANGSPSSATSSRPPPTAAAALSPLMPRSSELRSPAATSGPTPSTDIERGKLVHESRTSESTEERKVEIEKSRDEAQAGNEVVDLAQQGGNEAGGTADEEKAKNGSDTRESQHWEVMQPEEPKGSPRGVQTPASSLETSSIGHESQKPSSPLHSDSQHTSETPKGSLSPKSVASPSQTKTDHQASADSSDASSISAEVKRLEVVVAQREQQLMNAMLANTTLNETMGNLRSQLEALTAQKQKAVADHENLVKDLTSRLEETNRLLAAITKERDSLKNSSSSFERTLADKEEQIKGLMEEGEKLSKTELKSSTMIKKLRTRQTELEKEAKELQKKLDQSLAETAEVKERLARVADSEKRQNDSLRHMAESGQKHEAQVLKLESDLNSAKELNVSLQAQLDRAWQQLAEVRKQQAEANSVAQTEALEREIKANEQLHQQLDEVRSEAEATTAALKKELQELRMALARVEDETGWKEDVARKEITGLQNRLQAAEARNEELSSITQNSTKPLLRQIEMLQQQHAIAQKQWEHVEESMTIRLREMEVFRSTAAEKERAWSERLTDLNARIASADASYARERQEKSSLLTELESARHRNDLLEIQIRDLKTKIETLKNSHARELEDAKENYEDMLQHQLEQAREQIAERERQRVEKEVQKNKLRLDITRRHSGLSVSPRLPVSSASSVASKPGSPSELVSREELPSTTSATTGGSSAVIIERLQSALKQYEGQMAALKTQLQMAGQSRDEMAEELVKVTNEVEESRKLGAEFERFKMEHSALNSRYLASLELLGEKEERVQELEQDIQDLKDMYRTIFETRTAGASGPPPTSTDS
ncbi:TATA element modulatory factor 1 TATA binding-domain-containing protein [Cladochytrium replicatum]|nr:TATA element modulatory factor 1 TATA binding-domain-containing protein [Cladochytrium replicatum]